MRPFPQPPGCCNLTRPLRASQARLRRMTREEAIRKLWEAATEHWYGTTDEEDADFDLGAALFDSACAYPGLPLKGKDLCRIGEALGFIESSNSGL